MTKPQTTTWYPSEYLYALFPHPWCNRPSVDYGRPYDGWKPQPKADDEE